MSNKRISQQIHLKFPADPSYESIYQNTIRTMLDYAHPQPQVYGDVRVAVSEVITNVIRHAYPTDEPGPVEMTVTLYEDNEYMTIQVKDKGVGIDDVEKCREPLYTTGDQSCTGMGFTIAESFCDDVKVRTTPGKGTTVTLYKQLRPYLK